jgi:hypothetical protein
MDLAKNGVARKMTEVHTSFYNAAATLYVEIRSYKRDVSQVQNLGAMW